MNSKKVSNKKDHIIELFNKNIKGKVFTATKKHCGSEGHWLEKLMEIKINSKNEPDIYGYEMKKDAKKITFGDWSASEYLFSKKQKMLKAINKKKLYSTKKNSLKHLETKTKRKGDIHGLDHVFRNMGYGIIEAK